MMTVKDIYDSALRLLAESVAAEDNNDYEERAPYLIAVFCSEERSTDAALRRVDGKPQAKLSDCVYVGLGEEFPLLPALAPAASYYLASMLVIDDNEELSDKLYEKYCDSMSKLCGSIPAVSERICDRYFFS